MFTENNITNTRLSYREPGKLSLWKREKIYLLSWDNLGRCLQKIRDEILAAAFQPTTVIGISRGGLIPATYLAHAFGIEDFELLGIARNTGDDTFCSKREPELKWTSADRNYEGRRILLVDDVSGEGKTLDFAVKLLKDKGAALIQTAVIVAIQKSEFVPDYVAIELDDWVVFPWERSVSVGSMELPSVDIQPVEKRVNT